MGMTPVHVNIASDESEGLSSHIMLPPAGSGVAPSDEAKVLHAHPPGAFKHKITDTVFHRKRGIIQHGHDCGACIPDAAPAGMPAWINGYLPVILLKSSRKVMFGASTVKAQGTAIGGAHTSPDLPMLSCGDPLPIPLTYPLANHTNTVLVGFSQADIDRGWEDIEDAILIELACLLVSAGAPVAKGAEAVGGIVDGIFGRDINKTLLGAGVGLIRSIERSAESGWTEPISLKVETGGGAIGGGIEAKWTPATGEREVSAEIGGFSQKRSAGARRDKDGNWNGTGAIPPDLFE